MSWISWGWAIHPVLIGLGPILGLYTPNMGEVRPSRLVRPVLFLLLGLACAGAVFGLPTRDVARAALLTSTFTAAFFLFGRFRAKLSRARPGASLRDCGIGAAGMCAVAFAVGATAILLLPRSLVFWANVACLAFGALIVAEHAVRIAATARRPAMDETPLRQPVALRRTGKAPDIYYIIPDGYGRADVLRELYGFDNSEFLGELERRGFTVAKQSVCNYPFTPFSLASSLNFRELGALESDSRDRFPLSRMIHESAVAASLRGVGYRIYSFATGFPPTELRDADCYVTLSREMEDFERYLIGKTPLALWLDPTAGKDAYTAHRRRIERAFELLPAVARKPGPKFVFAHLLAPHAPFVFGADGSDVSPRERPYDLEDLPEKHGGRQGYIDGYVAQIRYMNGRLLRVIDEILYNSAKPPVIVIQGDHGPRLGHDGRSVERTDVFERIPILNAFLLPGREDAWIHDGISPVNTFRMLFDLYFDAELPLLPDRSYSSIDALPFRFVEVTERVLEETRRRGEPGGSIDRRTAPGHPADERAMEEPVERAC